MVLELGALELETRLPVGEWRLQTTVAACHLAVRERDHDSDSIEASTTALGNLVGGLDSRALEESWSGRGRNSELESKGAIGIRRCRMVRKNSNSVGGPWRLADEMHAPAARCTGMEAECLRRFHRHEPLENQCSSSVVNHIKAPVQLVEILSLFFSLPWFLATVLFLVGGDSIRLLCQVWSLVRRFDQPQSYKPFVSRCIMRGDFAVGCLREVNVKSGLPATTSTERLEQLDDNEHILGIKIVGGDHRLQNYSSVLTVHPEILDGGQGTLVVESFIVDVPEGNTKDDTCFFVEALIKCNLKSLAVISERLAVQDQTEYNAL
ncbi:hypothetical protein ZIOFF_045888 [Zingiber officinale]|uniref:Uncharacterized protein n=1 Tax=Zingiber officinale TaxID=94328 RepID=A0A8J5KYS0_ZINOF|nr:hypothetical protein ZIOFF_045888 [Zingiber officinale]